jgi:Na+-transporting NADH:ubiquinone oxidoreductase subunit C
MKKEVWMVMVLVLVATISAGVLGFVNVTTRPIIKENEARKLRRSVLSSVNVDYNSDTLEEKFKSTIETREIDGKEVFFHYGQDGEMQEVAFRISGSGFQGQIQGIISLKPDLQKIVGLRFLSQQETPGLGARITEDWFLKQFNGKVIKPRIEVVKGGSSADNEVDAITGATRTSKSVQAIINNNVEKMKNEVLTDQAMEGLGNE